MNTYNVKPEFTNWSGYQQWLKEWSDVYQRVSDVCKARKREIKAANSANNWSLLNQTRSAYQQDKANATEMMELRQQAVMHWKSIKQMHKSISEQAAQYPLTIEDARNIDLYFNKKHLQFPLIPMWALRTRGQTFYVNHLDCQTAWSTREKPDDKSTKGMIRIKRGTVHINKQGDALIS